MTHRTIIGSNGKPRRLVLLQPPHYRTGQAIAPMNALQRAALDAIQALRRSDNERSAHYRSTGTRPVITR